MSGEIYLSRFEVHNFRSFGEVRLSLPPIPGVVVLEGPNGLGKTTWFEAIELALTGAVHRWEKLGDDQKIDVYNHLRRAEVPERSPCRVSLGFSASDAESSSASWDLGVRAEHTPAVWLCPAPEQWALTCANLSGFLRGTHLLPQSPHIRLLHLPEERRWEEVLRNVSGYSEITGLSDGLQASAPQITLESGERSRNSQRAQEALDAWRLRVAAAHASQDAARTSAEAVPPSSATRQLDPLDVPPGSWTDDAEKGRLLLTALASVVDARRAERVTVAEHRSEVALLSDIPGVWVEAKTNSQIASVTLEAQRSRESDARRQLTESTAAEALAKLDLQQIEGEVNVLRKQGERSRALLEVERALPESRIAITPLQERMDACRLEHESVTRILGDVQARQIRRLHWEERQEALVRRHDVLRVQERTWAMIRELEQKHTDIGVRHEALKRTLDPKRVELALSELELGRRQEVVVSAQERARIAREAEGEVHTLLASLAAHLRHHDTVCPLCLAEYGNEGLLLERVVEAQSRQSGTLAGAEEDLRVAREAVDSQKGSVAETRAAIQDLLTGLASIQDELDGVTQDLDRLRREMPTASRGQEPEVLRRLRAALEEESSSHAADPSAVLEPTELLALQVGEATKTVQRLQHAYGDATRALEAAESDLRRMEAAAADARSALAADPDVSVDVIAEGVARSLAAAEGRQQDAASALRAHVAARETAEQVVGVAQAATSRADAEAQRAFQEVTDIERRWISKGLVLPPTTEQVSTRVTALEVSSYALERRLTSLGRASVGIERWLELASLQEQLQALDEEAGGHGLEAWRTYELRLEQVLEERRKAAQRAVLARDEVTRMSKIASKKRDNMRRELDDRLGQMLTPLLRSLITNPEVAEAVLQLHETRKKTRVGASLRDGETPLLARVSEGQLAGVNLSVQLAMALAFPWSRWPAVLLDDPTQYSDIIHSANLVETLRMFASQCGFQVFISTHDHDFARYVEQKFLNDGLSARRLLFCEPRGVGEGVVPRLVGGR